MTRLTRMVAAVLSLLLFSGCSPLLHAREVENLQLVQTVGFDGTVGNVTVSVSSGAADADAFPVPLAAQGASIQTAMEHLQDFSAREELFFAHIRYAAIGESAARGGIAPVLDYFERSTQTQLTVPLFVVRGGTARELAVSGGDITAMLSSLESDTERQGSAHCFTVLEIAARLNRSGAALACAVSPAKPEGSVPDAGDNALLALETGYAVLRGDALCGFLDRGAALGADILLGFSPQASYVLSDGSGGTVTVQLRTAEAKLSPGENGAALDIAVRVRAGVTESSGADPADAAMLALLENELSRAVKQQVTDAAEASRRLDADFLELWRVCPAMRGGTPLADLTFRIQTDCVLERSYDIYGSAHGEEDPHG